jgi:hypothetical protein
MYVLFNGLLQVIEHQHSCVHSALKTATQVIAAKEEQIGDLHAQLNTVTHE